MTNRVAQIIFTQILDTIERLAPSGCSIDRCHFDYSLSGSQGNTLVLTHIVSDNCGRVREFSIQVDITRICIEDLTTCSWVDYINSKALEMIEYLCAPEIHVVPKHPKKCRERHPVWTPTPCKTTTYVTKVQCCPEPEPECEVIVEEECSCIEKCVRKPCVPKHSLVIRNCQEQPSHNCCPTVLVPNHQEHSSNDSCCDFYSAHQ